MQSSSPFNANTIDWQKPGTLIDTSQLPEFDVDGDAIIFDYRTLHGTGDATVKSLRRAFSTRWLGDDATYCERAGETSPPYRNHGMRHGERMREDWFPVLWRRA